MDQGYSNLNWQTWGASVSKCMGYQYRPIHPCQPSWLFFINANPVLQQSCTAVLKAEAGALLQPSQIILAWYFAFQSTNPIVMNKNPKSSKLYRKKDDAVTIMENGIATAYNHRPSGQVNARCRYVTNTEVPRQSTHHQKGFFVFQNSSK